MRFILLLFVICVKGEKATITTGLNPTAGREKLKYVIGPIGDNMSEASKKRVAKYAEKNGVGLDVNEDVVTNETNFVRPCGFDFKNIQCIRKFLKDNSKCKPAYGSIGEFYVAQNTEFISLVNVTITCSDFTTIGLDNYKIIDFYYNKVTCKLVIAFEIKNLIEKTPMIYFSYHRTGKESIVLADYAKLLTRSLIITVIIPNVPDLKLESAETHSYIDENPNFEVGPMAYTSNDIGVQRAYAELLTFLPIVLRERALFKTDLHAAIMIQKTLCDFGVKLYRL